MRGFSLVELSIVLVILGLLTGGILAGQSLIRASELRTVGTEYQRYLTAAHAFRDKYFYLPGDMPNATAFWTRQVNAVHCVTNSAAAVSTPGTCDGNGDGNVDTAASASQSGESFQFWKQLANGGLLEGSYTGLAGTGAGGKHHVVGTNSPRSKFNNAGWGIKYLSDFAGSTVSFAYDYDNSIYFGAQSHDDIPYLPALKPEEAWNIDSKLDDGQAGRGKIIANYWNNLCSAAIDGGSALNDLNVNYRLSDSTVQCALYFPKVF